jgi:CBS domain-containing protein
MYAANTLPERNITMTATASQPRPLILESNAPPSTVLDRPVRSFMRSGVVVVPEGASVRRAQRAMLTHDVSAILVVSQTTGRPLGWVTGRDMLNYLDADTALMQVSAMPVHTPEMIEPSATAAQAVIGLTRSPEAPLLVMRRGDVVPEGSVSERDLLQPGAGGD